MPLTPEQIAAAVDAQAAVLGLPLDPAHRPGVLRYYALAAGMADEVFGLPLGLADEPAPVFVPVEPADAAPAHGASR
ncbi:DUF4089 domain-containing protein [Piscinibacter sakaiensis]|uniref:DUF4089 domain-containing protein n=1 Tax=Piscinibacter sakaiensis TaxID=1547922 RepID=A0A0K8NYE8_PISS1|nr:DUF4089 domain-containing protein [Piscinibacter sakaiensis]GAP34950.1 hypothetical protein ISF6_0500 [Piscinibacter sakaiensis]